jgi:N-acetylneuraminic acid mutarotase
MKKTLFASILLIELLLVSIATNVAQGNPIAAMQLVNTRPNTWLTKSPIPQPGAGYKAAMAYATIFVIGNSTNYAYDRATDKWTEKTPMPTPRTSFAVAAFQNKIYVIGGTNGSTHNGEYPLSCSINEVYDPATDTWSTKASMPTNRSEINAEAVNGKIYVMGGRTAGPLSTTNITELYDPISDSWSTGAPMIYPVIYYASAGVDNKIYVIGGQDEYLFPNPPAASDVAVNCNQIYDPTTNAWSLGAPIPETTWQAGAGATTGVIALKRIFVIGGSTGFLTGGTNNYAYDPTANNWSVAASMPTERYLPAVGVFDDILYVIGGGQGYSSVATNEQYVPMGYNSTNSSQPPSLASHPSLSILSPTNTSYAAVGDSYASVPLTFEANTSLSWVGYSLDSGANVTASNGTMIEIPVGSQYLTVYANDTGGNWAAPQTVYYSVAWNGGTPPPEPFLWLPIAAVFVVVAVVVAVASVAVVVYLKKRRASGAGGVKNP